jgi:hypothetical protein
MTDELTPVHVGERADPKRLAEAKTLSLQYPEQETADFSASA